MYLSQQKNNSFLQSDQRNQYFVKEEYAPSKVNVLPPKMHRVASVSSNVYPEIPSPISLSQQSKPSKIFSKNKTYFLNPSKNVKDSFNSHSEYKALSNQDLFQRYSCNLDLQKNSDILKYNGKMYFSTDRRIQPDLQSRVRELQEKMRKNQQNLKFYFEQIGHFKIQLSSSSSSNLLDSINTNALTSSTRDPLKQISNIQSFNNKQNLNKNILSTQSDMNSPKELDIQKKVKQIDLIKKQIKKIISKQQNLKGHVKMFHDSMKDMVKSFKQHLERSLQSLIKRQDKNKKKIFDQVTQTINEKMKQIQNLQSQNLKKALQNLKRDQKGRENLRNLYVGNERFIGDPILIKVRQEVFGLIKKQSQLNSFNSYVDMIKRNLNNDLGKQSPFSSMQSIIDIRQINGTTQQKVIVQESQTTYYLDPEGYLIDSQGYYLIDNDEKIKLTSNQLQKLQYSRILQ